MFQRWLNYDVGVMDLADLLECSICLGQEESSVCLNSEQNDFNDANNVSGLFFLYVIRNRIRLGIRILPSLNKNIKKNLYFYCFVTSLWLFVFNEWCKCIFKKYGNKQKNRENFFFY